MDDLPLELKQRVCSYLTTKDLKSLRSISKGYAAATDRYLLPRIFLFNHPDSFEEIRAITDNPQLRHSVTTLVVDTSCLPLFPKFEKWAKFFVDDKSESGKQTVTRAERALRREKNHEQWTKYQERAMAQRSSRNSMLNVIALAFQKCPRLSNLIIECYGQHDFGLREDERQDRFYQDIHPVLGKHIYASWRWRLDSMQFDIWDILKPAHDVDRPLSSLVLLDRHITCPSDWTIPTTKIFQSLKHLRHLGNSSNFLQQIVARAPGLESIGILGSPYSRDMCSLHSLIGQPALKRLRTFGLNRLALVQADLVPLILRHASTLQHLSIKNETYDSRVDWPSFARRVRGQLPSLRRVELFGLCQSFRPWLPVSVIGSNITGADLLQNHAYDLETGSVEVEDGLWEDYEKLFFSEKRKS